MNCPRREEVPEYPGMKKSDVWEKRGGLRCCSFCGSLHPDDFMDALEKRRSIATTSKNYKVYVMLPNPRVGKRYVMSTESRLDIFGLRINKKTYGREGAILQTKFYFQHLSDEQQRRFIELANEKALVFEGGFGFSVPPFFASYR